MSQKLAAVMPYIFQVEGGFVDNPNDPGGRTNLGITQTTYDQYRQGRGESTRDVAMITTQEAVNIYEQMYWVPGQCEWMPWPTYLFHFDCCVNLGKPPGFERSIKLLQRALKITADGVIGPQTRYATNSRRIDPCWPWHYVWERQKYYSALISYNPTTLAEFARGWTKRLDQLLARVSEGPSNG